MKSQKNIKSSRNPISLKILLFLAISLSMLLSNTETKLIKPKYNNGDMQDPSLDKLYQDIPGRSVYFITSGIYKTLYNVVFNSKKELEIEISLKMYTDSEIIIKALDNGFKIYLGFDLMIDNFEDDKKNINTDIIICIFDKKNANCYDYAFNNDDSEYIRNDNGYISKNNLIPLGFSGIELNILDKNVIDYQNYYSVSFKKIFADNSEKEIIYGMINDFPNEIEHKVIGFYGVVENENDLIKFSNDIPGYYKKIQFGNGAGIRPTTINLLPIITALKYGLFFYFTFLL